jgi:hypothetical protein
MKALIAHHTAAGAIAVMAVCARPVFLRGTPGARCSPSCAGGGQWKQKLRSETGFSN